MNTILALGALKAFAMVTTSVCKSKTCLKGKTAIVTGAQYGTSWEVARDLASRGCKVIVADKHNLQDKIKDLIKETHNKQIIFRQINLDSFKSVRNFAENIIRTENRLDILINCVRSTRDPYSLSDDGLYKIMQVNYLGHFLLVHLLVDLLKKTPQSRIVHVSSSFSFFHSLNINSIMNIKKTKSNFINHIREYGNSKVCVLIACRGFAERLKGSVTSNSVFPGLKIKSHFTLPIVEEKDKNIYYYIDYVLYNSYKLACFMYGKTHVEHAQTILHVALEKDLENITGKNFMECTNFMEPLIALNKNVRNKVWEESEKLVQLKEEEKLPPLKLLHYV